MISVHDKDGDFYLGQWALARVPCQTALRDSEADIRVSQKWFSLSRMPPAKRVQAIEAPDAV